MKLEVYCIVFIIGTEDQDSLKTERREWLTNAICKDVL